MEFDSGVKLSPLSVAFATRSVPMHGRTPWEQCLGGSESAMVFVARALAARGHHVEVFTRCEQPGVYDGVTYHDIDTLETHVRSRSWDVFVALRIPDPLLAGVRAALRVLWCQDVLHAQPNRAPIDRWLAHCDRLLFVSEWHREQTCRAFPMIRPATWVTRNPICHELLPEAPGPREPLLIHLSRPERGLRALLDVWPSVHQRIPQARLLVARYLSYYEPAGSPLEAFCLQMDAQVRRAPGAEHIGHLSKPDLYALLSRATMMVYPAEFDETACIAAIESQACGLPILATTRGALPETIAEGAGRLIESGPDMRQQFSDKLVELFYDEELRREMGDAGRTWAASYSAEAVAEAWERQWQSFFEDRARHRQAEISRTLLERSDRDAADSHATTAAGQGRAPWPGWRQRLLRAALAQLSGCRRLLLLGEAELSSEVRRLSGAAVFFAESLEATPPVDGVIDLGALLDQPDRAAWLKQLADAVGHGTRVVHLLPTAGGDSKRRVHPTYDDILNWFGDSEDVAFTTTVEAEVRYGEPASCWIVSYPAGSARCRPDHATRKRVMTRPRPTLSVCMIVRDAADTVLTALHSVLPVADEIRIVDTGSVDGTRLLEIQNTSAAAQDLQVNTKTFALHVDPTQTGDSKWATFSLAGSVRTQVVPGHRRIEANAATTWYDLLFWGCDFKFRSRCSNGGFSYSDENDNVVFKVGQDGDASATSPDLFSALLELDSTANSGAKKWEVKSDRTNGGLKFTNLTDTGTPKVEITPSGSLYADEFLGTKTVTAKPGDTEGVLGAHVIDTSAKKIWVKVKDTGSDRWWYAALTAPAW